MLTIRYQPGDDYLTLNAQGTSTNPFEPDSAFDEEYLIELGEVLIREAAEKLPDDIKKTLTDVLFDNGLRAVSEWEHESGGEFVCQAERDDLI
jgi:hypothetical protein